MSFVKLSSSCRALLFALRHHPIALHRLFIVLAHEGTANGTVHRTLTSRVLCATAAHLDAKIGGTLSFATAKSTSFFQDPNFLHVLYIVAFALFIYGMSGLTGPRTAVRGNRIAAVGMLIAVIATLLSRSEGNWALIAIGIGIGVLVGVPAARRVRMTAMPQMVALFNGVCGGAVFLIAWAEFRNSGGYVDTPTYVALFILFAAIVG